MYLEFALVQVACGEWRGDSGWIRGPINTSQVATHKSNEINGLAVKNNPQQATHPGRFKQGEIE